MKKIHINRVKRHLSIVLIIVMMLGLSVDVLATEVISEPLTCEVCGITDGHSSDCAALCSCEAEDGSHLEGCPLYISVSPPSMRTGYNFSAAIYTAPDYSDVPVVLGTDTTLTQWEHDTDRYLRIDLADLVHEDNSTYKIVIKMQPSVYATVISNITGATYSFVQNPAMVVNTDANYGLEQGSGTITYTLNSGLSSTAIRVPLRYDNALWNKLANAPLGDGITPLISVSLIKITDGTETSLSTANLANAYTGTAMETNGSVGIYRESRLDISNSTGMITSRYDERVMLSAGQMGSQNYSDGHYYKELIIEVDLPRYTDANGTTHYMVFEDLSFSIPSGKAEYTSEPSADGSKVIITAKNIYYSGNNLLKFFLRFPDSVKSLDNIQFSGGKLNISRDNAVLIVKNITVTMKSLVTPNIAIGTSVGTVNTRNLDLVQRLGTYGLKNTGGDSGEYIVTMSFDTNDTADMHVTSINLMPDFIQEKITVTYTLVDENGSLYVDAYGNTTFTYEVPNVYSNQTPANNRLILFCRGMLPDDQRNYYFKTVSYSIKSIPANTDMYHTGAIMASYSAGTYWGYVDTATPSDTLMTRISVYDVETDSYPTKLQSDLKVVLDSTMDVPYGLSEPTVSTTDVIKAGESFTVGGTVLVVGYPYSTNSRLSKIQLGVLLPEGITINEETVKLNNKSVDVIVEKSETPVNGIYLWIVRFPETMEIGYYSETLSSLPSGASMKFSMTLNTDLNVSSHQLNMDEIIFAAGDKANNASGGSYKYYLVDEPQGYDLNNTGEIDKVAKFSSNKTITIQAAPAQLNITDGVRKADTTASATSELDHYADSVIYDLNIACENGGAAEDFFYFIPVPKASNISGDFTTASIVGLELRGPANLTTSGTPLQILYTIDTGLTYQSAQSSSVNWVIADQITDWSEVTLMKVILSDGYSAISNGSVTTISIPMYFAKKNSTDETVTEYDYASYAGMQIKWLSKGFYHYRNGSNIFAGDMPTSGATVTLQYTAWEQKEIILTAAKDKSPTYPNDNKVEITVEIPFKNEQVYTLASVKTKDVTLVSHTTPISDRDSNTHFGITVSVNDGNAHDILTENIETTVGSSPQNSSTKLKFTLHNGNALSDIVKERYVEIKLVGNNGVIIPVKIIINREMSLAGDAESAIQSGKEYIQVIKNDELIKNGVEVSSDSAFTAQFVVPDLIPDNYSTRKLIFSKPAAGTTVLMIDWTHSAAPRYYHYTLGANDTEVLLTQFTEMGSTSHYQYPTGDTPVTERFLFIVDLPDSGTASDGTIGLITTPKLEDPIETELKYKVTTKRTFSFSCEDTSVELEEEFKLHFSTSASDTADSRYLGRQFSIVIAGTGLSPDSKLVVDENAYYLNSDGMFIVPIGELKSGSCTMALYTSENTSVELNASLWVSANADAQNPMLGDKVSAEIPISISAKSIPSVKIVSMSDRILTPKDLGNPVEFVYKTENTSNLAVTLEVQVKDGNGYRTITTVLNTVNGATSQAGVYTIASSGGTLSLKFSSQTAPGTYRLLIKVSDGSTTVMEVPYNFIVTE